MGHGANHDGATALDGRDHQLAGIEGQSDAQERRHRRHVKAQGGWRDRPARAHDPDGEDDHLRDQVAAHGPTQAAQQETRQRERDAAPLPDHLRQRPATDAPLPQEERVAESARPAQQHDPGEHEEHGPVEIVEPQPRDQEVEDRDGHAAQGAQREKIAEDRPQLADRPFGFELRGLPADDLAHAEPAQHGEPEGQHGDEVIAAIGRRPHGARHQRRRSHAPRHDEPTQEEKQGDVANRRALAPMGRRRQLGQAAHPRSRRDIGFLCHRRKASSGGTFP